MHSQLGMDTWEDQGSWQISHDASTHLGLWRPGHEDDCSAGYASDRIPPSVPSDELQQDKKAEQTKERSDTSSRGHIDHELRPLKLTFITGAKSMSWRTLTPLPLTVILQLQQRSADK